jgi:hypothetical protein
MTRTHYVLIEFLIVFSSYLSASQTQVPITCRGPLTEEQLTRLLTSGVADRRVQEFVSQCGADFEMTDETEQRLQKKAGATQQVINLARTNTSPRVHRRLVLRRDIGSAISAGQWREAEQMLAELRALGLPDDDEIRRFGVSIEEHESVERKKQEEIEEQRHRDEIRLSDLCIKIGVDTSAVPDLEPILSIEEARRRLAILKAQTQEVEDRLKAVYPELQSSAVAPSRDTFTKSTEYQERQAIAIDNRKRLEQSFSNDLSVLTATYARQIAELVSRQYNQLGVNFTLASYDPDNELLFTSLLQHTYWFKIPPSKAKSLYARPNRLRLAGNFLEQEQNHELAPTRISLLDLDSQEKLDSIGVAGAYYVNGFAGSGLALNGNAKLLGNLLQLTGGAPEVASVFWATRVGVRSFVSSFEFQLQDGSGSYKGLKRRQIPNSTFGGFTFVIQNQSTVALGPGGGGLGYAPDWSEYRRRVQARRGRDNKSRKHTIGLESSVAIAFELSYPCSAISLLENGSLKAGQDINCKGVDGAKGPELDNGDVYRGAISYDGQWLTVTIKNVTNPQSRGFLTGWRQDIPGAVGGNIAYVGFTAATDTLKSTQNMLNWSYILGSDAKAF